MDNREYERPKFYKPGLKVYKHGPCSDGKSYIVWVEHEGDAEPNCVSIEWPKQHKG